MNSTLGLVRLSRYALRRSTENERDAGAWRRIFHLSVQVLHGVIAGDIQTERLATLQKTLDAFERNSRLDGGSGSGNWGHEGRPGKRSGSGKGGGSHNRMTAEGGGFTSFSKIQKTYAKPHSFDPDSDGQISWKQKGTKLVSDGKTYVYHPSANTFEGADHTLYSASHFKGKTAKVLVPNTASPNYSKVKNTPDTSIEDAKKQFNAAFKPASPKMADDAYREQSGKVWTSISKDAQSALVSYTGNGYNSINKALRDGKAPSDYTLKKVEHITDAISKSTLDRDCIFYGGTGQSSFEKVFKLEKGELTPESVGKLVGREGTDKGFMSTGSCTGQGFYKKVRLEILAPKGTQALYAEPFSSCGAGSKHWDSVRTDGKSKQSSFSSEDETIIQQGTSMKIISASYDSSHSSYRFQVMVTGQKPKKLDVSK